MTHPKLNAAGNPPTLEEHRAMALTRPLTGSGAIGATTRHKRQLDAELSAIVSEVLGYVPPKASDRTPCAPVAPEMGVVRTRIARKPETGPVAPGMENQR